VLHVGPGSAELLDSGDAPFRVRAGRLEVGAGLAREDLQNAVSRALGGGSARLTVRRDGRQFDLIVSPSPGAPSRAAEIVALCTATGARAFDELPPFLRTTARLLTEGYPDKEIASRTGKSLATTRTYVTRVLCRLGVTSRRALIVSSRRN
jgi:DNA-binding NarL/FixJ family response regulator